MAFYSALRPNYRRAREIKADLDELRLELERAEEAGNFSQAQDLLEAIQEQERAFFLTGVSSEYDL